ncbi:LysR family transcriptional regulator [Aquabacter sp. CN5-332]|uniref:LysR family transcriptional regulator n=1 Tax=Aquabacter sp. CN5-332 TaxID=3156608 RepID=UPI0032B3138C
MELRHLRYFVAVAEEGSLTIAAEQRLHTAQPSLSRQIRDLELEVGVPLLTRSARGVELTAGGKAFLDHARLALAQVEAAGDAARRAASPGKACFVMGFLTGQEMEWLPEALRILHDALPNIEVMIISQTSPELASGLLRGKIDVAFLRAEEEASDLAFRPLAREALVAILPSDHRLAGAASIRPEDVVGETFVNVSHTAPALKRVIEGYLGKTGLPIAAQHEADNLAMAISLVASTRGIAFLPAYAKNFLPWSVISRPIAGEVPYIDLMLGYRKANASAILKLFLSRVDELIARVTRGKSPDHVGG